MTITPEQLAEWKALAEAALPGPWEVYGPGTSDPVAVHAPVPGDPAPDYFAVACEWGPEGPEREADPYFIASAREAVPALLAEVERLRRFAPLIDHLAAQYAERGNLDADMARIASGEAVPFTTLHAKGCNGRHDDRTRC